MDLGDPYKQEGALPPYSIETYPVGCCIIDSRGLNVLCFKKKPGAKFTTKPIAEAICDEWNNNKQ